MSPHGPARRDWVVCRCADQHHDTARWLRYNTREVLRFDLPAATRTAEALGAHPVKIDRPLAGGSTLLGLMSLATLAFGIVGVILMFLGATGYGLVLLGVAAVLAVIITGVAGR